MASVSVEFSSESFQNSAVKFDLNGVINGGTNKSNFLNGYDQRVTYYLGCACVKCESHYSSTETPEQYPILLLLLNIPLFNVPPGNMEYE